MIYIIIGIIILVIGVITLIYKAITQRKGDSTMNKENMNEKSIIKKDTLPIQQEEIYLAGGCFWGVEKYFSCIEGVIKTEVGYANGNGTTPTYEDVCRGDTFYAETVHVTYDANRVSLSFLLDMYYKVIDPTSINKQGADFGTQYRTGIFYVKGDDSKVIDKSLHTLQQQYKKPLAIEAQPLLNYFSAEEYHQEYLNKHPNGYCHISSAKFKEAKNAIPSSTTVVVEEEKEEPKYKRPSNSELKEMLTQDQYAVTQKNATEPSFQNAYWNTFDKGIYVDITTGEPIFVSSDKFSSECGWPSFSKPIDKEVLVEKKDDGFGMIRTEVRSKTGDAHLGHVFNDGPLESGGLRYCINSASLKFIPMQKMEELGYQDYLYLFEEDAQKE